jgi:hypothetical protein
MPRKKVEIGEGNRAIKAVLSRIIRAYAKEHDCDPQAALRDVLTDMRHLSDCMELDWHEAMEGSYDVYLEERHADGPSDVYY